MPEITWDMIIDNLNESDKHINRFETNADGEILCKTEADADCIADFLECLFNDDDVHTSTVDTYDGFKWAVYID